MRWRLGAGWLGLLLLWPRRLRVLLLLLLPPPPPLLLPLLLLPLLLQLLLKEHDVFVAFPRKRVLF